MRDKFSAGEFEAELSSPYPVWVKLLYRGQSMTLGNIRHDDLADLRYVIDRAMNAAKIRLGKDGDEVA